MTWQSEKEDMTEEELVDQSADASDTFGVSRRSILASVATGSIAGLAGCSGGGNSNSSQGSDTVWNGRYSLNPPQDLYFNPFATTPGQGMGLQHWAMLFTGIARYDRNNPKRALSAIYANHPRHTDPIKNGTATISIREDEKWHNGDNYTARDYATGRMMELYLAQSRGAKEGMPYTDVRVIDDYTVEVDMRDPSQPHDLWWDTMYGTNLGHACCTISNGPIWVKHSEWSDWLQRYEDASNQKEMKTITQELQTIRRPFEETIGHGPFKISEIRGQTVVYEPHEGWQGLIAINLPETENHARVGRSVHKDWLKNDMTAELTFYADSSAQAQAALGGQLDYARLSNSSQGKQLVEESGWKLLPLGGQNYASNTLVGYHVNFNYAPLSKTRVRKALLELMNQQQLAQIGFENTEETSQQSPNPIPIATGLSWASATNWLDKKTIQNSWSGHSVSKSNTTQATNLLKKAGLSKKNGNWRTADGRQFTLEVKQSNTNPVEISRSFKSTLDSFGIQTNLTVLEGAVAEQQMANGDFDLFYDYFEPGSSWPGTQFQGDFAFSGKQYPWASGISRQVGHPSKWKVPSTIGDPSSSPKAVNVAPLIQQLNVSGNDFQRLTRQIAWVFNQTVPSLIYANGEYHPSAEKRRAVGHMYNANNWQAAESKSNAKMNIYAPGAYPQTRHLGGDFKPKRK